MIHFNLKKIFSALVGAFVAIGSVFYIPVSSLIPIDQQFQFGYFSQELFFRYGSLFLILFGSLLSNERRIKLYLPCLIFFLFLVIGICYGFDLQIRRQLLNLGIGLLLVKTVAEKSDDSILKCVGFGFLATVLINLAFCLFQYFGIDGLMSNSENLGKMDRVSGLMRIKVHLGALSAIASPFLVYLSPALLILVLPLLIFSKSSVAVCAVIIALVFLIYHNIDRLIFIALSLISFIWGAVYVLFFDMPSGQFGSRFEVWHQALFHTLKSNPVTGLGLGSFPSLGFYTGQVTTTEKIEWIWAHNEFLQVFVEGGLVVSCVLALYAFKCLYEIKYLAFNPRLQVAYSALLVILSVSFFHFPFHIARLAIPFLIALAVFERERVAHVV